MVNTLPNLTENQRDLLLLGFVAVMVAAVVVQSVHSISTSNKMLDEYRLACSKIPVVNRD